MWDAGEACTRVVRACRACSALVWSCARRRAASAGEAREAEARASECATVHFVPGQILCRICRICRIVRCTRVRVRSAIFASVCVVFLARSRLAARLAVPYATDQRHSLPGATAHQAASANMGKNAHIRVPMYQQQQALRKAAKQFVDDVSSPPTSSPSEFVPAARAEFSATPPATRQPIFDISLNYPTAQHASTSQVGTWTWPEHFYPRSHLPPTCTWAPPPERKCNGQGGGDHACAPAVDLATLLQLTAWIERLDAIMRMHDGEDEVILKIRTRAIGVLDSWVQRWEV